MCFCYPALGPSVLNEGSEWGIHTPGQGRAGQGEGAQTDRQTDSSVWNNLVIVASSHHGFSGNRPPKFYGMFWSHGRFGKRRSSLWWGSWKGAAGWEKGPKASPARPKALPHPRQHPPPLPGESPGGGCEGGTPQPCTPCEDVPELTMGWGRSPSQQSVCSGTSHWPGDHTVSWALLGDGAWAPGRW